MSSQKLLIWLIIVLSAVIVFFINRKLQRLITPKKSFLHLISYFILALVLVFGYTFLIVSLIYRLFPANK